MGLINYLPKTIKHNSWPWRNEVDANLYSQFKYLPKITIITPSFNQGEFIEETIRSVLLQNYPNLEFFIIDGGSKDSTINIIKRYEKWINYWTSHKDKGQADAINKGLKLATGSWIAWINSDDIYLPNAFVYLCKKINELPMEKWFAGNTLLSDFKKYNKTFKPRYQDKKLKDERYITNSWVDFLCSKKTGTAIPQPSSFWSNQIMENEELNVLLHYALDYELNVRLARKGFQPNFIQEDIAVLRIHPNQKTNLGLDPFIKDEISIVTSFNNKLKGREKRIVNKYRKWLINKYINNK